MCICRFVGCRCEFGEGNVASQIAKLFRPRSGPQQICHGLPQPRFGPVLIYLIRSWLTSGHSMARSRLPKCHQYRWNVGWTVSCKFCYLGCICGPMRAEQHFEQLIAGGFFSVTINQMWSNYSCIVLIKHINWWICCNQPTNQHPTNNQWTREKAQPPKWRRFNLWTNSSGALRLLQQHKILPEIIVLSLSVLNPLSLSILLY